MENKNQTAGFFRSSAIYFVGTMLSKIAVFFLLPIYTAHIPPSDMGTYDTATAVAILVASVLFMDLGVGLLRFMPQGQGEQGQREVFSSGMVLLLCSCSIYFLVAFAVGFSADIPYFPWIACYGILNSLFSLFGYVARAQGHNAFFAAMGVVATMTQIAVNLVLILLFGWDYSSLYIAFCAGMALTVILFAFRCRIFSMFSWRAISKDALKTLLRFCLPLGVSSAAYWLLNSVDRVLVNIVLGTEQVGYYTIASKFTQIMIFVSTCFQFAWQELSFSRSSTEEDGGEYYSEKIDLFLRIFMVSLLVLIPASRIGLWIFPGFIDAKYADAIPLIPLALVGAFVSILSSFLTPLFGATKRNGALFFSTVMGAIVNVAVIFALFANGVGVMAANIAFLAGYTVNVIFRLWCMHRAIGLRVKAKHLSWFLPAVALVVWAFSYLAPAWQIPIFLLAVLLTIFMLRAEIVTVVRRLKKRGGGR